MESINFCSKHTWVYLDTVCPVCADEIYRETPIETLIHRAQDGDVTAWKELGRSRMARKQRIYDESVAALQADSDHRNCDELKIPSPIFYAFTKAVWSDFYKKWAASGVISLGCWEVQTDYDREFLQTCGISVE